MITITVCNLLFTISAVDSYSNAFVLSLEFVLIFRFIGPITLDIPLFFQAVFPRQISSTYYEKTAQNNPNRCIINSPSVTMGHPIIDFDVKGNCDMILDAAESRPDCRSKSLVAVVRGMGSGKTRCLEEIRRELLLRQGVLPIGITFNAGRDIIVDELTWGGDYCTSFALMVLARCASALYDINLERMRQLMLTALVKLDFTGFNYVGYSLIDMFLRSVVSNERSRGKRIDYVVIIVDEVVKTEVKLKEKCESGDACSILRAALLDEKSEPFDFNAALCISSLELSACGDTQSGRSIKPVSIPSALSPSRIVKEWWKAKKDEERILSYVAACVNTLPRAVEIVENFLIKHSDRSKNQKFIKDLFVYLREELSDRYVWKTCPEGNLLYSIIFAKRVPLDDTVQRYVAQSILLNSVETCTSRDQDILPISSLTVLAGIKNVEEIRIKDWTREIYEDTLKEIGKLAKKRVAERIPFESFVAKWLKYLWLIAIAAGKEVKLGELLGIHEEVAWPDSQIFKVAFNVVATASRPTPRDFRTLKVNSYNDIAGHLKEVEGIFVDANHLIAVRRGAKDDEFDLLIIIFQGEGLPPLRFYIDHKSLSPGNKFS